MKKYILLFITSFLLVNVSTAQLFDLSAEIRPRFNHTEGYKTLMDTNQKAANFISQRSRLNFDYKYNKITVGLVVQNVRVWGDVKTVSSNDLGSSFHEAWAEASLTDKISLKLGRQEIAYDDHRIFGSVNWAQEARSHDAAIFKYKHNKNHKVDIGLALNADSQNPLDKGYSNIAGYKSFQYLWYHGDFKKLGISFLALNTGIENIDSLGEANINNLLTLGPRFTYKTKKFSANAATYIQAGKTSGADVNSLYFTANANYKINKKIAVGAGMEYLSGKDMNDASSDVTSFAPLFGTNHKFNGWLDYFYVGSPHNSVGLLDINTTFSYKKDKLSAKIVPHYFASAAEIHDASGKKDNYLGTEIDFNLGYAFTKDAKVSIIHAQIFASESLQTIKGGDKNNTNFTTWVTFTFTPKLFSNAKKNKKIKKDKI